MTEASGQHPLDRVNEAAATAPATHRELLRLLAVVDAFRGEQGCAWYEAQTHRSLVPYLQEETAELIDAIETGTATDVREELGDVLFQVLFHADIAAEFDLEDVARDQADKLLRRNPHVFGPTPTRDIDEILRLWHEAKAVEKANRTSVLDGVAFGMPALALAQKVLAKSATLPVTVTPATLASTDTDAIGDALLALAAAAHEAGVDAEAALRDATRRLAERVRAAEKTSELGAN